MRNDNPLPLLLPLLLLAGCGPAQVMEPTPTLVFPDEPRCLSCDVGTGLPQLERVEPAANVRTSPSELLFYPTHGAADEHDPSLVTVINNYDFIVFVTRTRIDDDIAPGTASGGSLYFAIDPITEWVELAPGELTALPVWFIGSERQQSALLHIYTTAYDHRRLEVALTGKTMLE